MILYIISALLASLLVLPFTLRRSCLYLWADVRYATNMLRTSLTMLSWYRRKPLRFLVVDRFLEQRIQTNRSLCSREKLSPSTRPTGWAAEWPTICRLSPATELETRWRFSWVTNLAGSGWTGLSSGFHQPQHPQQGSAALPHLCRGSGVDSSRRY